MAAKNHLNSALFGAYKVTYGPKQEPDRDFYPSNPFIEVTDHKGNFVGKLSWTNPKTSPELAYTYEGRIIDVEVARKHRRKGIATEMWKLAEQLNKQQPWHYPKPKHSDYRTPKGDEWAWSMYDRGLSAEPPDNTYDEDY